MVTKKYSITDKLKKITTQKIFPKNRGNFPKQHPQQFQKNPRNIKKKKNIYI